VAHLADLKNGDEVSVAAGADGQPISLTVSRKNLLVSFWENCRSMRKVDSATAAAIV